MACLQVNFAITFLFFVVNLGATEARAESDLRYENSNRFSSSDYLLRSHEDRDDPVFDRYPTIDLGVDLGIGSDCGKVDFRGTMRATLENLLDANYFGNLGKDIMGASPLLLTCYFSPTWCAALKHMRLNANFLSQMRLDQCALVDKYTDSRVDDFYQERQECVRRRIKSNGGNLENAMQGCDNVWNADLTDWTGSGRKVEENRLIGSSAKWAGFDGSETKPDVDLVKALAGDVLVSKGRVSIDYGQRRVRLTPSSHLRDLQKSTYSVLCDQVLTKVHGERHRGTDRIVSNADLRRIGRSGDGVLVDRQTLESLSYMPRTQRTAACRKLADGVALTKFTGDLERSISILAAAAQNPHLPPARKAELSEKRRTLQESMEMTLELKQVRNEPLAQTLAMINREGSQWRSSSTGRVLSADADESNDRQTRAAFFDCADNVMCEGR